MNAKITDYQAAWDTKSNVPALKVKFDGEDDFEMVQLSNTEEFLGLMALLTSGRDVLRKVEGNFVIFHTATKA